MAFRKSCMTKFIAYAVDISGAALARYDLASTNEPLSKHAIRNPPSECWLNNNDDNRSEGA
jgi:hypothetical protein